VDVSLLLSLRQSARLCRLLPQGRKKVRNSFFASFSAPEIRNDILDDRSLEYVGKFNNCNLSFPVWHEGENEVMIMEHVNAVTCYLINSSQVN
jgi:hypothetical protein